MRAETPNDMRLDEVMEVRGRSRRGFTLIETILAMMLFAIAVVVLASSYVNILESMENVRVDQTLEQELAFVRAQLLMEPELDDVEKGGEVPTPSYGMASWEAVVAPTTIADLFRVELSIRLEGTGDANPPREISQTLHVLRPDWSEPTERENLRAESRKRLEEARRMRPL
jgi:prepilin-type N-terminal cleavage/methylation domain-containing protein